MRRILQLENLACFAEEFLDLNPTGSVVGLSGSLGAGKTTFVRSLVHCLASRSTLPLPRVMSPSYVFHQSYPDLPSPVEHFDFYRLENADESALVQLGYFEALNFACERGGFVFVEWPEKVAAQTLLRLTLHIEFEILENSRRVSMRPAQTPIGSSKSTLPLS